MIIIKSKNFILRPIRRGDEKSLQKNINNKKIYRNTITIPFPYTLKDAKKWIDKNLKLAKQKKPERMNFVIEIDNEAAGEIELMDIEYGYRVQLQYWLGEKYWGKGIMSEAVKLITKFGFEKLKLRRIYVYVYSFNKASQRVLEKNGYKLEGILKKNTKKDNKLIDDYVFAKIK